MATTTKTTNGKSFNGCGKKGELAKNIKNNKNRIRKWEWNKTAEKLSNKIRKVHRELIWHRQTVR